MVNVQVVEFSQKMALNAKNVPKVIFLMVVGLDALNVKIRNILLMMECYVKVSNLLVVDSSGTKLKQISKSFIYVGWKKQKSKKVLFKMHFISVH